jgi:hypothetical protein
VYKTRQDKTSDDSTGNDSNGQMSFCLSARAAGFQIKEIRDEIDWKRANRMITLNQMAMQKHSVLTYEQMLNVVATSQRLSKLPRQGMKLCSAVGERRRIRFACKCLFLKVLKR